MKTLLVVAHGSRRAASNQEVMSLVEAMRVEHHQLNEAPGFDHIAAAFLELAKPSISDAIDACVESGSTHITVLPYFLSAGRHVVEDIPSEIKKAVTHHPDIDLRITGHIGALEAMPRLLLDSTQER